jgi:serine/threonine protein phosphatase PrpC
MDEEHEITEPLDTGDLQEGWEAKEGSLPRYRVTIRLGAKTDLGQVRENNEDKFDFIEPDDSGILARKGRVYAVADGMGGHSAGQIASELGLKTFIRAYYQDGSGNAGSSLKRAVRDANTYVVDVARSIPGRSGMGTTLTAAVLRDDDLYVAQVGDSRLYLLRNGQITQVTQDHSWVAEHVRRGTMTREEAEQSPHRNVITRSLGGAPEVAPDIFELKVQPGDRYVICSDGLSGMVADEDILSIGGSRSPSVAAWDLVELANEHGGVDNVTVMVLEVVSVEPCEGAPERDESDSATLGASPDGGDPTLSTAEPASGSPEAKPRSGLMRRLFNR